MTRHCFTYGSLMCEDIMRAVSGRRLDHTPAVLAGYVRHPVAGERYPAMVPHPAGHVAGVLYLDLPPGAFERLDAFEGDQYQRRTVQLSGPDGTVTAAETYVFKPAFAHLLQPGDWDYEEFLRTGRTQFEAQYLGYGRVAR